MNKLQTENPLIIHTWKICLFKFGVYSAFLMSNTMKKQRKNVRRDNSSP